MCRSGAVPQLVSRPAGCAAFPQPFTHQYSIILWDRTGYAAPADFVSALQDAGSALRARDAVHNLSTKLQQFVGAMRVVWRGCLEPIVVLELMDERFLQGQA